MDTKLKLHGQGIYAIQNKVNGKIYVGSSGKMERRKHNHIYKLRRQVHNSKHLQNAWNKYGENAFEFICLEQADLPLEQLLKLEKQWIEKLQSFDRNKGYNIRIDVVSNSGWNHSEETKQKLSLILKGKNLGKKYFISELGRNIKRNMAKELQKYRTPETEKYRIEQIRKAYTGRPVSESVRKRSSESNSGSKNGMAVLTEKEVMEIKILLRDSNLTQQKIADQYAVSRELISRIKLGKRWVSVQIPESNPKNVNSVDIQSGNLELIYESWKNNRIRTKEAVRLSAISKSAFYKKMRKFEGNSEENKSQKIF